ncbi:MAG TPA: hypothetical protein VFW88_07375 [Burkholderiales bacterium]|nr:hypothetical protein [Burkholderiales bacterium]
MSAWRLMYAAPLLCLMAGAAYAQAPVVQLPPHDNALQHAQHQASHALRQWQDAQFTAQRAQQDFLNAKQAYDSARDEFENARKKRDAARARQERALKAYRAALKKASGAADRR